jgi:hypothetical protein
MGAFPFILDFDLVRIFLAQIKSRLLHDDIPIAIKLDPARDPAIPDSNFQEIAAMKRAMPISHVDSPAIPFFIVGHLQPLSSHDSSP